MPTPEANTMHDWLLAVSRRRGEAVAVHDDGRDVTYGDLWARIEAFAAQLKIFGVGPGDRVLVALPNCLEYVVTVAGAWRAGAVAVPLHPQSSPREVLRAAADCSPRLALAIGPPLDVLRDAAPATCRVFAPADIAPAESGERSVSPESAAECVADAAATADSLAMILYTSGTTGQPKGVMLSHGNLVANFSAVIAALELTPGDSTLQVLPACYAYGNSVLWTHLLAGGRVALARDFVFWSRALDAMQAQRVSGFYGVPATFALLLGHSDFLHRSWPHLRNLACAGGGLPAATVQRLRGELPAVRLHLMYGQTEATARLSVLPADEAARRPKSIGRGITGVTLTVRDDTGDPVSPGTVGHLTAQGPNVMQGYWNDPEETARVLRPTGLWTGDLAYADQDDFLYVVGRAGERIKFGSHRIHPAEIEEVLHEHPSVIEAAVTGAPDETWGEVPFASVVLASGCDVQPPELLQYLAERLPRHKLPRQIWIVSTIPKTTAGKIDRAALKQLPSSVATHTPA